MPQERLAHFLIQDKIGQGGMGVVYRGLDTLLQRRAALKVLPAGAPADPRRRRRFLEEARAAASRSHANVARIYEVGEPESGSCGRDKLPRT